MLVVVLLLLASASVFWVIRNRKPADSRGQQIPIDVNAATQTGGLSEMEADEQGVTINLSEGQAQPQATETVSLVEGEPLSAEEIEQILARLPALTMDLGDQVDFKLAQEPIPPPRAGETIEEPFPPTSQPTQPSTVDSGPLEVLRYAPEGEIPIAPFVNITFNQPMVPLGSGGTDSRTAAQPAARVPAVWAGARAA